jgi:hypothetical protein
MASGLSAGTKYAPDFNQAARNVACIAHLVSSARLDAESAPRCAFVLIAPREKIAQGTFEAVERTNIAEAVERRARSFDAGAVEWCSGAFRQVLDRCDLTVLSWEEVLDEISSVDPVTGAAIGEFYVECLRYNPLVSGGLRSNHAREPTARIRR